jgi:hypothetical protein
MSDQALSELTENRIVKARVTQLESKSILPINSSPNGVSGLAVREILDKLE